ncbi:inositol monophosphatase family protein [Salinarimonas sp.]|uniref:inositol monophosphatase family protein n=1 Tax=Salinarimonas sp. TaxID=2766526 RepID=UPI0032D999BA
MILFGDTRFGAIETALERVEHTLTRLWLSELSFVAKDQLEVAMQNGHAVTKYDLRVRDVFIRELAPCCSDTLVFEEDIRPGDAGNASSLCLVDPIDATHNLTNGYPSIAASAAFIEDGQIVFSWVMDIARQSAYVALRGGGAFKKTSLAWRRTEASRCRTLGSSWCSVMAGARLGGSRPSKIRSQSCLALDACLIASGQLDGFVDLIDGARHKVCDVAAAALVVRESGGFVFDRAEQALLTDEDLTSDLDRRYNVAVAATKELGEQLCQIQMS